MSTAAKKLPGISDDLREELDAALLRQLDAAISACTDRNELFQTWDAQLRGDPYWAGIKPRWRGGSQVEDPITREHHLTVLANICQVLRQEEWWTVNATAPGDEQDASDLEAWLNDKVSEFNLSGIHGYDLAYNAARHTFGVLYCGWKQAYETTYATAYEDNETGERVDPEGRIPGHEYKEVEELGEEIAHEGLDLRVPHAADFYLFPSNAQNVEQAQFIAERMFMSAGELIDGITDFGYEEEGVTQILSSGPSTTTDTVRREANDRDGVHSGDHREDDLYEVFMVIGRPPLLLEDGASPLKEEVRRRDYLWMVCPSQNCVFKCVPMPFRKRPYVLFPFLREPGRLMGDGVPSLLSPLQLEGTLALRFRIDTRDVAMNPTLLVPENDYDDLQRFKVYPGAMIPYKSNSGPGAIAPLKFDTQGFGAALTDSNDFRMRAAQLFSAQARGSITTNEKTAQQVAQEASGADEKFDLILINFHMGVNALGPLIISHYQQFGMSDNPDENQALVGNKVIQLSPEMLQKKFRINAHGTSENSNPELRLARAEALYQFVLQNPLVMQKVQQGDMTGIWSVSMQVARDMGQRDPQRLFGQEPQPPPSADMILQQLAAAIEQFAMQGDPAAAHLLQMLQQMQASQPPQQGQGAPGQAGGPVKISMNYKDADPGIQDQIAMMAGMQPSHSGPQGAPERNGVGH